MNDITKTPDDMLEVTIKQPDDFLKIRETLTRMEVLLVVKIEHYINLVISYTNKENILLYTAKELFALDANATLSENDIQRRNTMLILLQDWPLLDIVKKESAENNTPLSQIKVLPFKEKRTNLSAKYNMSKTR